MAPNIPDGVPNISRRTVLQTLAAAGTIGLAGCSTNEQSTSTTDSMDGSEPSQSTTTGEQTTQEASSKPVGGTWTQGTTAGPSHLVPYLGSDQTTQNAIGLLMDWGGVINENLEVEPMLFKSWELSDSNDVLTVKLRENLRYSDPYGKLTAEDYIYQLNKINQNQEDLWHGYPYTGSYFINGEPIEYEKTGKYELRAELPAPRPNWLFTDPTKWMKPLPKKLLEPYIEDKDLEGLKQSDEIMNATWTGNLGPYRLETWDRQSKMVYKRNPDYYLAETEEYKDAPYFDEYVRQVFNESSTIQAALQSGDVTYAGLSVYKADQFKKRSGVQVWTSKFGPSIDYLALNQRANGWEPFRKKEVRQAFAMAIDKDVIIKNVQEGYGTKVHTWSPKWGPYYDESEVWIPSTDLEKARNKIDNALSDHTYENGELLGPDGNRVNLKIAYVTGWKSSDLLKEYLKRQYEKLGVKITLEGTSQTNLYSNYLQNSADDPEWSAGPWNNGPRDAATSSKSWDIIPIGFDHAAYTPWEVMGMLFPKQASFNYTGYYPSRDDLQGQITQAAEASTQEQAQEIVTDLLGYLSREQPVVFTDCGAVVEGYRKRVAGLEPAKNQYTSNDAARELYFTSD